jgi:glyoxylate reductase
MSITFLLTLPYLPKDPNQTQEVAKRAVAFGMKIQYHNRHELPASKAGGATFVSFDDLISTSDVISLNLGLTHSTEHIIGAKEFEKMKDGVVIVNTARGALIDEEALISALETGKVYSVGLDVFENEPNVNPQLLKDDKVVLLPHIGAATVETLVSYGIVVVRLLADELSGRHGEVSAG